MKFPPWRKNPKLSIIVNFYNMRREARRTLYSLTPDYQQGIKTDDYEVMVLDNGSPEPLDEAWVLSHGTNFSYHYIDAASPSPVMAMNRAIEQSRGGWVMCCIDGARILSPGLLRKTLQAIAISQKPFVYTLGMHIGAKPQNLLVEEGYNQQVEDELLKTVNWKVDGYKLFRISSVALSSRNGYFSDFSESNAFCLKKRDFMRLEGFDERFCSKGGGLVNLDFFNKIHDAREMQPVLLLGEATFHQFHGGVATNKPMAEHPWERMVKEYKQIRGCDFVSAYYPPVYFGDIGSEARCILND